ncbi:hypothetical protein MTR67_017889 [Solanum verrucosum]|uniref:Uncharacterized protein n=1 Tax=Solanum verrucosum TaxID=315347 RepID=A0AAF0TM80_SOLVR|nr:hypothetical protein MTR67_017889 [Solanum verrucosum]
MRLYQYQSPLKQGKATLPVRVVLFLSSLRALLVVLLLLTGIPVPTKAHTLHTYYWTSLRAGMPPDLNVYSRPRGAILRAALHTMGLYNLLDLSIEGIQQWAYLKASNEALKKETEVLKSRSSRAKTGEQSKPKRKLQKSNEIPSGNNKKIERPVLGLLLLWMDNMTLLLSFLLAISFLKMLILQPQDVMTYSVLTLAT